MSYPTIWQTAVVTTALKILLFPAYKSTDFEVHRNWLAITHSLPLKQWYFEDTSQWTLDYPPFFAYFEWLLSQLARFIDAKMLLVENLNYDSWQTLYFQRFTVMSSELILVYALHSFAGRKGAKKSYNTAAISILLSPGLLMIDHIHFQYNGFLFGILVLSITLAEHDSTRLISCILFAALLCFKHIFLYLAPAYAVYILRVHCLHYPSYHRIHFNNSLRLGISLITIFALAFGPFIYMGQMQQLLGRLFPFSRGLCHAYWAPNFWALYSFADRVLLLATPIFKFNVDLLAKDKMTRGLVGDTSFGVLPKVAPKTTFLITFLVQIVSLAKLFIVPQRESFVISITLCSYASFLFGWHVHEKAVLLIIIPFSLVAITNKKYLGPFRMLSFAGYFGITPLLFGAAEAPVKVLLVSFWMLMTLKVSSSYLRSSKITRFNTIPLAYAFGILLLSGYCSVVHYIIFGDRLEFFPLMMISTYSAVGVLGSWLWTLYLYLVVD